MSHPEMMMQLSARDPKCYYPTGRCFDHAVDCLMGFAAENPNTEALLVHGIVSPAGGFGPYAHAWVEDGAQALEPIYFRGSLVHLTQPTVEFYLRLGVQQMTKYTLAEVFKQNARHVTYGPWEEKYLNACRQRGEGMRLHRSEVVTVSP